MSLFENMREKYIEWEENQEVRFREAKAERKERFNNLLSSTIKQVKNYLNISHNENNIISKNSLVVKESPLNTPTNVVHNPRTQIANHTKTYSIGPKQFILHPDLHGLIWFIDGPNKNYVPYSDGYFWKTELFTLNYSIGIEPSAISIKWQIIEPKDITKVGKPPYNPSYERINPEQRGLYLHFLSNPYIDFEIGYVFILYYGLERHLLYGNFDKAYDVILKLRSVHKNGSFSYYSSKSLVLSCIIRKNFKVLDFIKNLDTDMTLSIDINIYLLCLITFTMPFTAEKLIRYAKSFMFTNDRYIKMQLNIFTEQVESFLLRELGHSYIPLQVFFNDFSQIGTQDIPAFANISIIEKTVQIPDFLSCTKFVTFCDNALGYAHEATKRILREQRKTSKVT